MVSETLSMKAELRERTGTREARAQRAQGRIPAVIYGHGEGAQPVSLDMHEVELALSHGVRSFDVLVGSHKQHCLIKEVQYDHLNSTAVHLDLTRVDADERVQVTVGIELRGVPKGVAEGGVLDQHMVELQVECQVTDIPETLHPLVEHLQIGDSLYVKDLEMPPNVVALDDPEERIATVSELAIAEPEEEEAIESEGEESAEPERIGRVRKDEEEEKSD